MVIFALVSAHLFLLIDEGRLLTWTVQEAEIGVIDALLVVGAS